VIKFKKQHIPPAVFLLLAMSWSFFYLSNIWLNDYGRSKPDWLFLIDILVVVPVTCLLFMNNVKEALLKSLVYGSLLILLGSLIIPASEKMVWLYLEPIRYVILGVFVLFELSMIMTVVITIKGLLSERVDPDDAISTPIVSFIGRSLVSDILSFEARVWTYFFFYKRVNQNAFKGQSHYMCHEKDGVKSNLLAFIILILIELPIVHLLIHLFGSALAANIVTGLTLLGIIYFVAEYRAISIRPISLDDDAIIIRYGVCNPLTIKYDNISPVSINRETIRRASNVKRFNLSGVPNIHLQLQDGRNVYLGVDRPQVLIKELSSRIHSLNTKQQTF